MKDYDDDAVFLKAEKTYEKGDFKKAFDLYSMAAIHGSSWAQNFLGVMYGEGQGVERDDEKSLSWHKLAARNSKQTMDFNNVARQYEIMGNRHRAFYWWNKAVEAGDKSAGFELAKRLLQNGRSDSRKRAIELLQVAADAEFPLEICESDCEEAQELLDDLQKETS